MTLFARNLPDLLDEINSARWSDADIAAKVGVTRACICQIHLGNTVKPRGFVEQGIRDLHARLKSAGLIKFDKVYKLSNLQPEF